MSGKTAAVGVAGSEGLPGQAVYTAATLKLYDAMVLGFSNRLLWGCPTAELVALYDANVSANHLDAGVATGYFLDRCRFPSPSPRLCLLDLNALCLATAAARVARYRPQTLQASVLAPVEAPAEPFDSLGITYLLHCLPGPSSRKAVAFANLKPLLNDGARVFGATILGRGVRHNALGRQVLRLYNARGIFGNAEDDLAGLRDALTAHFTDVALWQRGTVALFTARR
ncbi:MAG TPA: class I SAM-dependent methyltransferase [Kiloniellaceae bacterium]